MIWLLIAIYAMGCIFAALFSSGTTTISNMIHQGVFIFAWPIVVIFLLMILMMNLFGHGIKQ